MDIANYMCVLDFTFSSILLWTQHGRNGVAAS